MKLNHIIIFSENRGQEADELVRSGISEGSNRTHPGQGTTNRKFYFDNFFLEFVWVTDENEVRSGITGQTGLWERSCFLENGSLPYGFCFNRDTPQLDTLFRNCIVYKPRYIPEGTFFEIIPNTHQNHLPWICRLPGAVQSDFPEEPCDHLPGMRKLTHVSVGVPQEYAALKFLALMEKTTCIEFYGSARYHLKLVFDHEKQGAKIAFQGIPLTLRY